MFQVYYLGSEQQGYEAKAGIHMGRGFDFGDWKPKHGHFKPNFLPSVQFPEVGFNVFPGEKN